MIESFYPSYVFQERKPNIAKGFLLLLLTFFFTFYNPQLELPTTIEPSSISVPASPKTPALKADHAVKFVSRGQRAFKLTNSGSDDDLNTPQSKYTASFDTEQKLFNTKPLYQAFSHFHYQRFYTDEIQPRAPPYDLANSS